jgi:hypothetical protein
MPQPDHARGKLATLSVRGPVALGPQPPVDSHGHFVPNNIQASYFQQLVGATWTSMRVAARLLSSERLSQPQ